MINDKTFQILGLPGPKFRPAGQGPARPLPYSLKREKILKHPQFSVSFGFARVKLSLIILLMFNFTNYVEYLATLTMMTSYWWRHGQDVGEFSFPLEGDSVWCQCVWEIMCGKKVKKSEQKPKNSQLSFQRDTFLSSSYRLFLNVGDVLI